MYEHVRLISKRSLHVVHLTLHDTGDTYVITKRRQFIPRLWVDTRHGSDGRRVIAAVVLFGRLCGPIIAIIQNIEVMHPFN